MAKRHQDKTRLREVGKHLQEQEGSGFFNVKTTCSKNIDVKQQRCPRLSAARLPLRSLNGLKPEDTLSELVKVLQEANEVDKLKNWSTGVVNNIAYTKSTWL